MEAGNKNGNTNNITIINRNGGKRRGRSPGQYYAVFTLLSSVIINFGDASVGRGLQASACERLNDEQV